MPPSTFTVSTKAKASSFDETDEKEPRPHTEAERGPFPDDLDGHEEHRALLLQRSSPQKNHAPSFHLPTWTRVDDDAPAHAERGPRGCTCGVGGVVAPLPDDPQHPEWVKRLPRFPFRDVEEKRFKFRFDYAFPYDMIPWYGALPRYSWWRQLLQPEDWVMLISCVFFPYPAALHILMRESPVELNLGIALAMVAVTSPLGDTFFQGRAPYGIVQNGELRSHVTFEKIEMSPEAEALAKRLNLVQSDPENLQKTPICHADGDSLVIGSDRWNNLARLLDRLACVYVLVSALLFTHSHRNSVFDCGIMYLWLGSCFVFFMAGGHWRRKNPVNNFAGTWQVYKVLHVLWHVDLTALMVFNALWRGSWSPCSGSGRGTSGGTALSPSSSGNMATAPGTMTRITPVSPTPGVDEQADAKGVAAVVLFVYWAVLFVWLTVGQCLGGKGRGEPINRETLVMMDRGGETTTKDSSMEEETKQPLV